MHLHPDAVELAVDEEWTLGHRPERLVGRLGRPGEHRPEQAPDDEPDVLEGGLPAAGGDLGDDVGEAGEHHGPPDDGVGHGGRLRDGGEDDAVEGALAQVPRDQLAEEALLVGGGAGHEGGELGAPGGGRAGAGRRREPGEGRVDLGDGQGRLGRGLGEGAERPPAHAQPPLREDAGEERDDGGDLVGPGLGDEPGDGVGLGGARARGGDRPRDGDELGEGDAHQAGCQAPSSLPLGSRKRKRRPPGNA